MARHSPNFNGRGNGHRRGRPNEVRAATELALITEGLSKIAACRRETLATLARARTTYYAIAKKRGISPVTLRILANT